MNSTMNSTMSLTKRVVLLATVLGISLGVLQHSQAADRIKGSLDRAVAAASADESGQQNSRRGSLPAVSNTLPHPTDISAL